MQSRLGRSLRQEQVDYTYSYTMLFNGFALRTARKNLETIQSAKGVSRAFVAGSYTLPTVEQADTQALQVALATNQFTGKGMTIAVLDTGLDTAHPRLCQRPGRRQIHQGLRQRYSAGGRPQRRGPDARCHL